MKILEIYDKNDRDILISDGLVILDEVEKYLDKFPSECRKNYDRNLETVSFLLVDEFYDGCSVGEYDEFNNDIFYLKESALAHELVHLASYDRERDRIAFGREFLTTEKGLVEGMTELIACEIMNKKRPDAYEFQSFVSLMLTEIDDIYIPYFKASNEEFMKLFPNRKEILSLMYSLNYYHNNCFSKDASYNLLVHSIKNTIDALIRIELSYENNPYKLKQYREKFMDLLSSWGKYSILKEIYPGCFDYANGELKKNIKIRKRVKIEVSSK